jgi:hypothetical protein
MTVEATVEIRPHSGLPEQRWCSAGGAPQPVLGGTAEVRILGEGGEAPAGSPELLAALEVERLRAALAEAERMNGQWDEAQDPPMYHCHVCGPRGPDKSHEGVRLSEHYERPCPYAALSAPPPDLGPLRELVAAWRAARLDSVIMPARLAAALDDLLAAYPCLGEGRWLPQL